MLYMVIEHYNGHTKEVFELFRERGRMLPDGLEYVSSWIVQPEGETCFQVMETDQPELLQVWADKWQDIGVSFEFFPVLTSQQMSDKMLR